MRKPLIDPRMLPHIQTHWPSRCTIQAITYGVSQSNQRIPTGTSDILVDVPCSMAPLSEANPTDDERRSPNIQGSFDRRVVKLSGYFPQIKEQNTAIVDGETWQIRGVEHDSQHLTTRLKVEIIRP